MKRVQATAASRFFSKSRANGLYLQYKRLVPSKARFRCPGLIRQRTRERSGYWWNLFNRRRAPVKRVDELFETIPVRDVGKSSDDASGGWERDSLTRLQRARKKDDGGSNRPGLFSVPASSACPSGWAVGVFPRHDSRARSAGSRPHHTRRERAGRLAATAVRRGDTCVARPSASSHTLG
jgi:hypothetical protein